MWWSLVWLMCSGGKQWLLEKACTGFSFDPTMTWAHTIDKIVRIVLGQLVPSTWRSYAAPFRLLNLCWTFEERKQGEAEQSKLSFVCLIEVWTNKLSSLPFLHFPREIGTTESAHSLVSTFLLWPALTLLPFGLSADKVHRFGASTTSIFLLLTRRLM